MTKKELDCSTSGIAELESANNWLDMALNNKEWMLKLISISYPLSTSLLARYADRWDWDALIYNRSLHQLIGTIDEKTIVKLMDDISDSDN
jgi:hypothetical protein